MFLLSTEAYLIYLAVILFSAVIFVIVVSVAIRKKAPSRFDKNIDVAAQEQWEADRKDARVELRDDP